MSCDIIQFSNVARPTRRVSGKQAPAEVSDKRPLGQRMREAKPALPPTATETAKNSRIRIARRDAWWTAGRTMDYWRARLDWQDAIETAQRHGIADSASLPLFGGESRFDLVDKWREALVKQLLTPAPDLAAISWKRAKLASRDFPHLPTRKERVERVIADDVAFLDAHPTRRSDASNSEAMARKREFNEAMRERIREIAASKNLSKEEIKPALSLKHYKLVTFVEEHGINWAWMLEGVGRVFTDDPIRLSPNSSAQGFAAVVAGMPPSDQQTIRTLVRDIVQERDQ